MVKGLRLKEGGDVEKKKDDVECFGIFYHPYTLMYMPLYTLYLYRRIVPV